MSSPSHPLLASRVLFADDDPEVRRAVGRLLRSHGLIVDLAEDGVEARALAAEHPYAVILTDQRMPRVSGLQLIDTLRPLQPDARFVLITGFAEAARLGSATPGVSAVLQKPWDESQLVNLVKKWVEEVADRAGDTQQDASFGTEAKLVLLLQEDEEHSRLLVRQIEEGPEREFHVVRARSLSEATELMSRLEISLVFVDLLLAGRVGLNALFALRDTDPDVPLVVMADSTDEGLARSALGNGAESYLLKGRHTKESTRKCIRDAIESKRSKQRLAFLAHHDGLTGLANQSLFNERLSRAMLRLSRSRRRLGLVLVNLAQFKALNDAYGHEAGDRVLEEIAERLLASTRAEDTVARLGGDDFAILLEDLDDAEGALRLARRVLNTFATPFAVNGQQVPVGIGIGIAVAPDHGTDAEEVVRLAQLALQSAKASGKSTYRLYSQSGEHRDLGRQELERELAVALDSGQFELAYQPQLEIETGLLRGYEAFLRWNLSNGSQLRAREFVSMLDEAGEILRVGRWVLDEVCRRASSWQAPEGARLSFNVSATELVNANFVEVVQGMLEKHATPSSRIALEVTEESLSLHLAQARKKLLLLAEQGIGLTVDNYGAGRSSFLELAELPITTLKLHPLFVSRLGDGRTHAALKGILKAAEVLGWVVVAKGVETHEQLQVLKELGCPRAQGYMWGPPASNLTLQSDTQLLTPTGTLQKTRVASHLSLVSDRESK